MITAATTMAATGAATDATSAASCAPAAVTTALTAAPAARSAPELDPATLVACRLGDTTALRSFVAWYQDLVFAFLSRSVGRGAHVEDLAQEVFLRACRALPRFEADGSARLSTWLLTIASRLVVDARRRRRVPTTTLESTTVAVTPGTPETERRRLELGQALEAAAARLSPEQRDVFVLAELHELPMSEIALVLGVPENTVKTRLFRARANLRTWLVDFWEEP